MDEEYTIINCDGIYRMTKEEIEERKRKREEIKRKYEENKHKYVKKSIVKKERVYTWDEILDCINLGN
tara:strand:+ start:114 stop:317 length:204 start_codon:yes stop_codon:yes gene_type:complete